MDRKEKRRRKHKALRGVLLLVCNLLFLAIGALLCFIFLKLKEQPKNQSDAQAVKTCVVSVAEECTAKAAVWLNGVEETYWDYDSVAACFAGLGVEAEGTYMQDTGLWQWNIAEEEYNACEKQAYDRLADLFRGILISQGHLENLSEEQVDVQLQELLGKPLAEYLQGCDIDLMPSKEELLSKVESFSRKESLTETNHNMGGDGQ